MKKENDELIKTDDEALKVIVNAARSGDKKAAAWLDTRVADTSWREGNRVIVNGRVIELGDIPPPRVGKALVSRKTFKVTETPPDGEVRAFTVKYERGDGPTIEYHASSDISPQHGWRFERRDTGEITEIDGPSTVDEVKEEIQKHYEAATGDERSSDE